LLSTQTKKKFNWKPKKRCLIQLIRPKGEKIKNKSDDWVSNVEKNPNKTPNNYYQTIPKFKCHQMVGSHSEMSFSNKKKWQFKKDQISNSVCSQEI
jgi:hypothetical protein